MDRRQFLKTTSTALGATAFAGLSIERSAHAAGDDTIKIALVGCGGRGSGAADQALSTPNKVKLVAMADAFDGRLQKSLELLQKKHPDRVDVPSDRQFVGLDSYKQAIAQADVVLLAAPPGFRPMHFEEAVRQGKHAFLEKPVATDAPGIRRLMAANVEAKKKNLKVAVGLQRHHQVPYVDTIKRIHDGAVGDILMMRAFWRGTSRGGQPRQPGETELQYQLRNWYFFTWLSGDHIAEQHVHNLDVCNWIKGEHPVQAHGLGGRQVRTTPEHGEIFDHFAVEFEYADGTQLISVCSQIPGLWGTVSEHVLGSKGKVEMGREFVITGPNKFKHPRGGRDPYQIEHDHFFDAIQNNKPYNEADYGATSTMTGIMGRMAAYSGKLVRWDEAINSKLQLMPDNVTWDTKPPALPKPDGFYPVAMPGKTVAL